MIFDDEFIDNLPVENWEAIKKIKNCFRSFSDEVSFGKETEYFGEYLEAYAFLNAFLESVNYTGEIPKISIRDSKSKQITDILNTFRDKSGTLFGQFEHVANENLFANAHAKFSAKLGAGFAYEFSEGDLKKVQTSINELRELISDSEIIEGNHKSRLLKRLEKLQSELHKKMSDLDRFWGFVGDAGVVMAKFGKDAKPFTDRIKDIMGIVWNTQARAEELESGAPNPFLKENNDHEE